MSSFPDSNVKKKTFFLAASILILAVLIPYWKLTLMQGFVITDDIFTSDIMNEGFPYRYAISEALKSGQAPLWTPHIYGGFPLLARAEAGVCYPLNLLFFGLLPPYAALNVMILLTLITAAVSMFVYVREIGGNFIAGLVGGIAFAFSGYLVSHIKHLSNVNAACWLPLGLFCIERAVRNNKPRYLLFLAPIFGLQHLSGHTQIAYYSGLVYIAYYVFRYIHFRKEIVREKKSPAPPLWRTRFSLYFIGVLVLGSVLGAVQLIPTYELVSLSQRSGGVTFDYAANYAYDPNNIFTFFYPYINGDIGAGTYTGKSVFWEDYGYVGIIILVLAFYAAIRQWKNPYVKMFSVIAVVSYFLVLGPNTPMYEAVFHLVPGMKYFRFPTRFLLITDFSLIVLGTIGLSYLSKRFNKKENTTNGRFSRFELLVLILVIADLWYFQLRQNPIVDADKWATPPQTAGFIREKGRIENDKWQIENNLFRIYVIGGTESHKTAFAKARGWQGDLQPYIDQREFLQPSSNVLYGFSTPDGYANLTPNYLVEVWGDQNRGGVVHQTATVRENTFIPSSAFWKLMNMYNVRYILSFWPVAFTDEARLLKKVGQVFLYENLGAYPRAYLVRNVRTVRTIDEAKRLMLSADFKPEHEALLYEAVSISNKDSVSGTVTVTDYATNVVEMNVSTSTDAVLVFSDSYYPGWKAEIDGSEVDVFQANITQRAVVVPAGEYSVRFVFRSGPIVQGLWITGIGCVIFSTIFLILFMKQRTNETKNS
jgi:hypothetical protein